MIVQPGGTIGVLGSGQLGRMFAMEAHRLGYRVHTFSPGTDTPAGQASDLELTASYDDIDALAAFARQVDVVTIEFENIPLLAVNAIERYAPVRPGPRVLGVAQNRVVEKQTLSQAGLPVPKFAPVSGANDIARFFEQRKGSTGPAVLKSAEAGYDGKGQTLVADANGAESALKRIHAHRAIVEELVDFEVELSVIGARSLAGGIGCFGPIVNDHRDHILDVSVAPAGQISPRIQAEAIEITRTILEELDVVGVLCVEFFLTTDGRLLINEIAPRPHNSGHLTIEAAVTSQFEQQVRAVCGLPLGAMELLHPAAMANLLGEHYPSRNPTWQSLLRWPTVKLHLYGKHIPRSKRKMGHLTATASAASIAESHVRDARRELMASLTNETDHSQVSRISRGR